MMTRAGVETHSQLADYLSRKYGISIDRRQIHQFEKSQTVNLIHILLREALEE
ncbi:MAG: hypothetical protein KZQ97_13920 [Candidatus Thiodiazotropha sp. (ex Dulcina madagascariensis)]|nr:hypothetical protein [Candidatus Thiodiazotropha sp. (ex Dulcina madagascariensis)]